MDSPAEAQPSASRVAGESAAALALRAEDAVTARRRGSGGPQATPKGPADRTSLDLFSRRGVDVKIGDQVQAADREETRLPPRLGRWQAPVSILGPEKFPIKISDPRGCALPDDQGGHAVFCVGTRCSFSPPRPSNSLVRPRIGQASVIIMRFFCVGQRVTACACAPASGELLTRSQSMRCAGPNAHNGTPQAAPAPPSLEDWRRSRPECLPPCTPRREIEVDHPETA